MSLEGIGDEMAEGMNSIYYPINLDIKDKKCLVVGGGGIAERKTLALLNYGGEVTLVSPEVTAELKQLSDSKSIKWVRRQFRPEDLDGVFLTHVATDDLKVNAQVSKLSEGRGILVNVVDSPKECNFIMPSILCRGDLTISICTNGKSPAYAKKIRLLLEKMFDKADAEFLKLMGELRPMVLESVDGQLQRQEIFEKIVYSEVVDLMKKGESEAARKLAKKIATEEVKKARRCL